MTAVLNKPMHIRLGISDGKAIDFPVYEELIIDTTDLKSEIISQPSKHAMCSTISRLLLEHQHRTGNVSDLLEFMSEVEIAMEYRKDTLLRLTKEPENKGILANYNSYISSLFVA